MEHHRRARARSPRGVVLRRGRLSRARRSPGTAARGSTSPIRTVVHDAETGAADYGVGGGITWDSQASARVRRDRREGAGAHRATSAASPPRDAARTMPTGGYRRLERARRRLRGVGRLLRHSRSTRRAVSDALDREAGAVRRQARARPPVGRPARARSRSDRRRLADLPEPVRLAIDGDHPVDPADPMLFHKTTLARALRGGDGAVPRRRRRRARQHSAARSPRRPGANIAVRRGGRWITPPLDAGLLPGCERAALIADGTLVGGSRHGAGSRGRRRNSRSSTPCGAGDERCWWTSRRPATRSPGIAKGRMVEASRGQAHSGHRGGSS